MAWYVDVPVTFVVGKGGVGSSTVAAAMAVAAAREGANVLFISVDGRPGIGRLLGGRDLDATDRHLRSIGTGRIRGRTIPASDAFGDYLDLKGVGGLLRRAASAASLPMIAAATPGLEHLLVLGKIKELERERAADVIVVDAPPAGHAAPFLRSADGLADVITSGPIRDQADEVRELLHDAHRTNAVIVTLPEETPVSEAIELAADVGTDGVGLALAPAVLNGCWPEAMELAVTPTTAARQSGVRLSVADREALGDAIGFLSERAARQEQQRARLAAAIAVDVVETPRLPTATLDRNGLDRIADALVQQSAAVGDSGARDTASNDTSGSDADAPTSASSGPTAS